MKLPKSNTTEKTEIDSIRKFEQLFSVDKFLIHPELTRDKGLDFQIELITDNYFSGFRFAVQLKAVKDKEPNNDGSISLSIDTSNLNYLLNLAMPSYYVLYVQKTKSFYYINATKFFIDLERVNKNINAQESHTIRFTLLLDANALENIYNETKLDGRLRSALNRHDSLNTLLSEAENNLIFDSDFNITSDTEIREIIESGGFHLMNQARWKEVIEIHKRASGNVANTAMYNLILGIAHYYQSNLIDSLSFLKKSKLLQSELRPINIRLLGFYEYRVKFSLGLITSIEFENKMDELSDTADVGIYIRMEKAKKKYLENPNDNTFKEYLNEIELIHQDPNSSENARLYSDSDLVLFEGMNINNLYINNVCLINSMDSVYGVNPEIRIYLAQEIVNANNAWYIKVNDVANRALVKKNYFTFYYTMINEVKSAFELSVYSDLIRVQKPLPGMPTPEKLNRGTQINKFIEKLKAAQQYYIEIGHIDNILVCLDTLLDIYRYRKMESEANETLKEIERIVEIHELPEHKNKLEHLRKNGTNHELFTAWLKPKLDKIERDQKEYEIERAELEAMDEKEKSVKRETKNNYCIQLEPIGIFQFPKNKKSLVYDILNVSDEIRPDFDWKFDIITPIANINVEQIQEEGYAPNVKKGETNSWKNIYRIRKAFFENKFYRVQSQE